MKSVSKTSEKDEKAITDLVWDTWPRLDEEIETLIGASEEELDRAAQDQRRYEEMVLEEEGPVNGYIRILEEEMDLLTERLNKLLDYVQLAEEWKARATSEYVLTRKNLASRLSELL